MLRDARRAQDALSADSNRLARWRHFGESVTVTLSSTSSIHAPRRLSPLLATQRIRAKQVRNSPGAEPAKATIPQQKMPEHVPRRGSIATMLAAADTLVASARSILSDTANVRPTSKFSLPRRVSAAMVLPYHISTPARRSSSVEGRSTKSNDAPKAALRASALARLAKAAMRRVSTVGRAPTPGGDMAQPATALASRCASRCHVAALRPDDLEPDETEFPFASIVAADRRSSNSSSNTQEHDYYTPAMIQLRARLRWDSKIRRQALKFWRTAKLKRSGMGKDEYLDFHLSVYRWLLHGATFDEEDAFNSGVEDWRRDVETGTTLSCDKFLKALYELADVYVDGIERDAYVGFLQDLFANVTSTMDRSGKRSWLHRWSEERKQQLDSSISDQHLADSKQRPQSSRKPTRGTWDMLRAAIGGVAA